MELLPEPAWADSEAVCLGCGYSLVGLPPPTTCPECGLPYSGQQYVVHGVADARTTMSPLRVVGIVLILVVFTFGPQILIMIGLFTSFWLALGLLIAGISGVVYFVVSAPRSAGGTARLVFDHAGATVIPLKQKQARQVGEKWAVCIFNHDETVTLDKVSDTWARLKIRQADGKTLFSGGIQVPSSRLDEVARTLRWIVASSPGGGLSAGASPLPPPLPERGAAPADHEA